MSFVANMCEGKTVICLDEIIDKMVHTFIFKVNRKCCRVKVSCFLLNYLFKFNIVYSSTVWNSDFVEKYMYCICDE